MAFSFDELKFARERGYSDDEIWNIISSENKEIGLAKERGYSLDEVASIESGQPMPSVEVAEPEPIEERGIVRAAGDVGVAFLQGGVGAFRSLTDVFGADNPASTALRGVEEDVGNLLSAQAKEDKNEVSRILTEAQDKGIYDQLIAGVEAFATAPVLTTAGAAGSIAVNLLGGITANAASLGIRGVALGAKGLMASQAAVGAAQGAGTIKGQIYDATESYLLEQGMSPEIAKKAASEAQSYEGKNLDSILLGTGLGAAAALTGVEKVAGNVILKQGGIPTKSAVRRFVTGTAGEMVPEAAQAGQEQVAQNLALQREGADVPTMRGVASAAALEGLAGGALGGPTSLFFDRPRGETPQVAEEREIDSTSDQVADELEKEPTSPATEMAMRRMQSQTQIDNLKTEIEEDELTLQTIEQTSPDRQRAELALSGKKTALANLVSEFNTIPKEELSETIIPAAAPATPTATKETTIAKIEELNKEFDALDENDQAGIERVNKAIFAEQNKIAELTAIEQGIDPQGTTPTRQPGLPESGRRSPFGTFYPDRPVLQAFMSATDKVIGKVKATGKRAQKLKNSIRTAVSNNAGFLAGTGTQVISSEEYNKLTGNKLSADSGTYKAVFLGDKKYLVIPDVNVLQQVATQGEQRAASRDAALDQESRAASKKLEEEMIHLSMFQGIQDEYKALKKPKLTEQEYIVKRISDIAKEVKRTNPNALPGVSEVYLNEKNKNLDDLTFSQEFMRMVIQRVRTGQITEDLNAIRAAEKEAFSDKDKGLIAAWKNSILNALQFFRNSIARYLGKGTSTKEVKRMEDTINNILDEYGIVKGEANYEFKDYSAAQPKGELKTKPIEVAATTEESLPVEAVSETITPAIEARAAYYQNFEVFDKNGENRREEQIVVEAETPAQAEQLIKNTPKYQSLAQRNRAKKIRLFPMGQVERYRLPGEFPIIARAGVTPQMDVEYAQAINGDTGNDTITQKTNQETWANNNPESADKIRSLIFQRLDEVGHLWKGMWKPPMFKAASRDFKSAGGDVGSFFAETKETAMDYLERGGKIFTAYIKMDNPANSPDIIRVLSKAFPQYAEQFVEDEGDWGSVMSTGGIDDGAKFVKAMQDAGYDGVYQWDGADSVAVVFNPNQAKSADLATFTSRGKVIPISERFSPESPLIARAGVTPEGEPMPKKSQTVMQKITTRMISDLEAQAEMLKPKNNKAYTEYQSRAAQKDKKWNKALLSPFSIAANLFTSNSFTAANNALDKIFRGNPDADFFSVAQNLAGMDEATAQRAYNISPYERLVLMEMMYELSSVYRKEVMDSNMKATARESFALESIDVEAGLARNIALTLRESGRMVQAAAALRKLVGAGMAIDTYKRNIIASMGNLSAVTRSSFNEVANAIRGDRRKSMDKVFNTQEVFRKAASLIKMSQRNPEKVRQSIRAEVSKKQTDSTRQILLDFASGLFDTKEDKYANMVVDQTVQNILSIGMNKKEFSIDNVTKFMYQSFAAAAKQMGIQQAGIEKQKAGKRSGKYLEMVKAVIGNDNAYKSFLNDLANRMAEKYQSRDAFNADFAELFKALRSNEWADKLRTQAIKDSADFLDYKFADLFTYLGSKRDVNQEAVKQHIRAELQGTGASNELIEKFIQDTDKYLNDETSRILQDKLGFRIDEKTGKVIPKPLMSAKIQEEAEAQFKAIKNLKDISKLSTSDYGNFKENLISRIITEVGMDEQNATELATLISAQMEKAMLAQRSENVDTAIKKAQEILANNKVKPKANQRTILQKLIEMANMNVLDSETVYEAFRQTHDFPKGFMPYDAEFANTLREWGDRISKLPAGVIRSIEEDKMGKALLGRSKFTTGDVLSSYWYFALISQASTSAINALSGSSNLIANVATWSLYNPKSFFPMMKAMYSAISGKQSAAVNSFLYVMRNGLSPSGMQDEKRAKYPKMNVLEGATPENTPKIVYYLTNFGDGKINFLPDWMNTALKNVNPRQLMRLMRATDMFLREVAYEAKAAQLGAADFTREGFDMAKRQAELELASSQATGKQKEQEIIIRANEIYREQRLKNEEKRAIAEQASLETAFNQDPQGLFGMMANFVNALLAKYPATKFVIPFTNVVANVTNEFLNYTFPVAMWRVYQSRKNGLKDPFTQGRADKEHEIAIKGFIGFAALVVPFIIQALTSGDEEDQEKRPYIQFYADGPKDPRQRKIWQQRGGQKYSVRVGDTYYSYLYTPLVIPLAMSAMLQEEIKSMKKKGEKVQAEDIGKLASSVLTAPFSVGFVAVLNQSFLTGLADLLEFKEAQDPVQKGTQFAGGIISRMLVPGAFRDINKLYTEDKAVGGDYLSNFFKDMPGSVNFLNKDVNYFGDDAKFPSAVQESGFGRRLASVVGRIVSTELPDPAWEVLYRNNLTPPAWDSSLSWDNGKRMTKEQELQFIREAGPMMRDAIIDIQGDLDELPLDEAQDLLSTEIRIIRREVKEDLQDRLEIPIDIE